MVLVLAVSALAAALAASCGGDGGGAESQARKPARPTVLTYDPEASTRMSLGEVNKREFLEQMNRTCREAWATVYDNWASYAHTQESGLNRRERVADAIDASLLSGLDFHIFDNFRILGAPLGEEVRIERIITPFQAAVELGWKQIEPADTLAEVAEIFTPYNQRARSYGLDDCLVNDARLSKLDGLTA